MGTPDFAVAPLRALIEHGYNILAVVTQPDRPKGRGKRISPSPVKQLALKFGIDVLQPPTASAPRFCDTIRIQKPDLLIVVAFGQILKKNILAIPVLGALNIHASLLPKYRGPAPIQWAIFNDEATTGLTAMQMNEGLDTGPILLQKEVSIRQDETVGQLHDRLSELCGEFLLNTIDGIFKKRLRAIPQDDSLASYAPKVEKSSSTINWEQPARSISAFIRGLDPWPGAATKVGRKQIKMFSSGVVDSDSSYSVPGRVVGYAEEGLWVEAGQGIVVIRELQVSGRKRLPAGDFLRGFPINKGLLLG
jgi:methionyl-tRNA formyltransferase